jgi:hypothetical protein
MFPNHTLITSKVRAERCSAGVRGPFHVESI